MPVSDEYYHLSFIFFFSLKESRMFLLCSEMIFDHPEKKITTEGWDEANIHYLFCASSFYILLLIERVIHVLLVSRNYKWPSRNKRYLLRGGMKLISKAKLKYLFCAHLKLLLSLSPDGLIPPVPLVSRNDEWSFWNKRYLLNNGRKWISRVKNKLLILCPFKIAF